MNREQKLAVVIGFALVLVVGVLLTDHYSRAQDTNLDSTPLAGGPAVQQSTGSQPPLPEGWALDVTMPGRSSPAESRRARSDSARAGQPSDQARPPVQPVVRDPLAQPQRVAQAATSAPSVPAEPLEITLGREQAATDSLVSSIRGLGDSIIGGLSDMRPAAVVESPAEASTTRRSASQPPEPIRSAQRAPNGAEHYVQPNESLYAIAKRYYGEGTLWRRLAEANPGKVGASGTIRPGVRLVLPPRLGGATLRSDQRQTVIAARDASSQTQSTRSAPAPRELGVETTYVVAKGDSLGVIAQRTLGSAKRMNEIIEANRRLITDADHIRVGMKLTIPAR